MLWFWRYVERWRFYPLWTFLLHTFFAGLVMFLLTASKYEPGTMGWLWPGIGLVIAVISSLGLLIPGGHDDTGSW